MASTIVPAGDLIFFGILILSRVDDISAKFPSGCPRCGRGEFTLKAVAMVFALLHFAVSIFSFIC